MVEASPASRYAAEFIGTFLLVFTVGCNVILGSPVWAATSIACVLMVCIYALGSVSGANFNPAVSLALGMTGKLPWQEVAIYSAVQLIAGMLAAGMYALMLGQVFTLGPSAGYAWWQAAMSEILYTFMLCFVVLNVAASKRHADKDQFYGLAIGFVIVAGGYSVGHICGGCFNPAVALGIDVSSAKLEFGWCLPYMVFECIGAALAALAYQLVRPDDFTSRPMDTYPLGTRLTSEFIGTYFLVLTVGLNVIGLSPAGAFSIAAALMCMIFALGSCSGAHFNPSVTLAVVASGRDKCSLKDGGLYICAQLAGAIVASMTYVLLENGTTFPLGPGPGFGWMSAGVAEMVFTFLLCFVVLSCTTTVVGLSQYFGLAIGACVIAGGYAVGAISGGALNPAVAAGIALPHAFRGGGLAGLLLYTGAQLAGSAVAAVTFMATHPSEYGGKLPM